MTDRVPSSAPSKVYVLTDLIKGAWQYQRVVVGIYATKEAAEKQVEEHKRDGYDISAEIIDEFEVNQ